MNQQAELHRIIDFLRRLAGDDEIEKARLEISSDGTVTLHASAVTSRICSLEEFCRDYPEYQITD